MTASTMMTIRLSPDLKEKLGRLARSTRRTKSFLAVEALEAFVDRELEIIAGIERGIADMKAGRVISHEEAMDQMDRIIEEARRARAAGQ
jgi:predicted transcriptional regulator